MKWNLATIGWIPAASGILVLRERDGVAKEIAAVLQFPSVTIKRYATEKN
jgi:hypothetical protein